MVGRHRCLVCHFRHAPIGEQVDEARRRLAMVPEDMRRSRVPSRLWPTGQRWCSGCQSFRELADFGKGASRCRPCSSASQHAASIEKVYGLTAEGYDDLLARQGGKCAICRGRPKSKRLAVDHDHKTGAVRGLLCSRCNHDLMGSAWDSGAIALALWHYLNTPPAGGSWKAPETGLAAPLADVPAEVDEFATVAGESRSAPPAPAVELPTVAEAKTLPAMEIMRLYRFLTEQAASAPF
jgi:hypothetical protein